MVYKMIHDTIESAQKGLGAINPLRLLSKSPKKKPATKKKTKFKEIPKRSDSWWESLNPLPWIYGSPAQKRKTKKKAKPSDELKESLKKMNDQQENLNSGQLIITEAVNRIAAQSNKIAKSSSVAMFIGVFSLVIGILSLAVGIYVMLS